MSDARALAARAFSLNSCRRIVGVMQALMNPMARRARPCWCRASFAENKMFRIAPAKQPYVENVGCPDLIEHSPEAKKRSTAA